MMASSSFINVLDSVIELCYNSCMGNSIEKLQALLQDDPSNFQARRELSILLANDGFNEEALSNLEYLVKYFPEDAELHYNLGILYEKVKDFKKAKKSYEKAIKISPQEDFYYNLGEVLVSLEEWDEAIKNFKKVLTTDINDGNTYFNIGLCYYNKEDFNLATDNFQKAVALNPKDIFALFYLANIYQRNGLTNFAEENYKKVLEISPDYSWAYYNLASIAFENENLDEAKEYLLKTIEYNKNDIEAYNLLTKICIRKTEFEEIITILETRLAQEENGDLYYFLAQIYKYVGRKDEYSLNLEKALENNLTLNYPHNIVRKELDKLKKRDSLDVQEVEEYDSTETQDEEYESAEEDSEVYEDYNEEYIEDDEILETDEEVE